MDEKNNNPNKSILLVIIAGVAAFGYFFIVPIFVSYFENKYDNDAGKFISATVNSENAKAPRVFSADVQLEKAFRESDNLLGYKLILQNDTASNLNTTAFAQSVTPGLYDLLCEGDLQQLKKPLISDRTSVGFDYYDKSNVFITRIEVFAWYCDTVMRPK